MEIVMFAEKPSRGVYLTQPHFLLWANGARPVVRRPTRDRSRPEERFRGKGQVSVPPGQPGTAP
eukprot:3686429-Prymnesium_polylepis.1